MGMALDEPNDQDKSIAQDNLTFVMAPDVVSIVDQNGGVSIDYVDDGYRKATWCSSAPAAATAAVVTAEEVAARKSLTDGIQGRADRLSPSSIIVGR